MAGVRKRKARRYMSLALKVVRKSRAVPKGYGPEGPPPVVCDPGPRDPSVPDPADYMPTPERVRADQRAAVAEAVKALGPLTPREISGVVDLAVDVVERRLAELKLTGGVE